MPGDKFHVDSTTKPTTQLGTNWVGDFNRICIARLPKSIMQQITSWLTCTVLTHLAALTHIYIYESHNWTLLELMDVWLIANSRPQKYSADPMFYRNPAKKSCHKNNNLNISAKSPPSPSRERRVYTLRPRQNGAILQTSFENAFSSKIRLTLIKFHWSLILWAQLTISQHWLGAKPSSAPRISKDLLTNVFFFIRPQYINE